MTKIRQIKPRLEAIFHLSYNRIVIKKYIFPQTPLLHLCLTGTRAGRPVRDPESFFSWNEFLGDHAAQARRDSALPAPEHAFHGAPEHFGSLGPE